MKVSLVVILTTYPYFLFIIYATYRDRYLGHYQWMIASTNALAGLLMIYVCSYLKNGEVYTLIFLMFVAFFGYTYRLQYIYITIASFAYMSVFQSLIVMSAHLQPDDQIIFSWGIWVTEFFLIWILYVSERTDRIVFYQQKLIQEQKNKAEKADQAKSVFLANMSHELRSPLNAILGFAQVMAREGLAGSATLPPNYHEHLSIIRRSGEHLLTLINQVLDLSKIEAGRTILNPQNFDLHRLLHDVQDMFSLRAESKGLHLLFEQDESVPRYVRTDDVKLRQVLINLLNNAMKFTEEGGVTVRIVDLGCEIGDCEAPQVTSHISHLKFEIEDSGPGIAAEEMEQVFEAFGQTETGRQSQEGTGLGLPISRKFVQLMGGDMQVNSQVGHGTLFTFEIQVQVVEASDLESRTPTRRVIALEPGQPRYRILVVDDLWTNRQLVIKLLNPLGFELREAVNGQEAIDIWETWKPHLIWMDMRMPVLDGYEATKRLKIMMQGKETAIIALTASSFEEERAVVLNAGCDDYLRKPFRETDLFELMSKHIGVKFVYETTEHQEARSRELDAKQNLLTPEALAVLPAEWVAQLKQGAEEVDIELLFSVIERIRGRNADLADALARLVEDFEYDEMLRYIQDAYPSM